MEEQKPQQGSKISNTEWGLYLGALATIDTVQFILDMLVIGLAANRFIDFAVGISKTLYLKIRGVKLDSKKIGGMFGAFIFEEIPGIDALPLWTLDGVMDMIWDKADNKSKETTTVVGHIGKADQTSKETGDEFKKAA